LSTDAAGLWNAGVGSIIPLTETVFLNPVRWLEVTVNDGVNPIETLPRIELRTNPYTYRSATSQQADSLGGSSLADLVDQFVDETGDSMSVPLIVEQAGGGTGVPSLRGDNLNDGHLPYSLGAYTFGVVGDAASDNFDTKFGLAGLARGTAGYTIGVIAETHGTGDLDIAMYGYSGGGASTNSYSGYFFGGDVRVDAPATPGTDGVMLPANVIDKNEILDEPGIALATILAGFGPALVASNTAQDFVTVSITTPAEGYIVVHGAATMRYSGTTSTSFAWMQIDQTAGGTFGSRYCWSGAFAHAGTSNEYETMSITRVYFLTAGTHTFRLEGNGYASNVASPSVFQAELLATFIPTAYGSVSSSVAERGDFEDATFVRQTDPQTQTTVEGYAVDLRQLELKAAREQAEAERAKRELVEAKLSSLRSGLTGGGQEQKQ
jgi:hypothetical protein